MGPSRLKQSFLQTAVGAAAAVAGLLLLVESISSAQVFPVPSPGHTPVAATPTPIPPGRVHVEVTLVRGRQRLPGHDTVAWISDMRARSSEKQRLTIAQRDKQFEPRVAVASVGSTVEFPNYDRVFHNVFSLSTPRSFDLGLYRRGKSKAVEFDRSGLVQVYCNIHPHMAAYLMVVDSRRHGAADDQGRIDLPSIPPGIATVEGWNVRGGMWSKRATIRPGRVAALSVELDITSWREVPHLNKHGKEYPPPDDDDFRY